MTALLPFVPVQVHLLCQGEELKSKKELNLR